MKRVRLHSGGISADLVRLSRRGASERRTAAGTDINDGRGPDGLECGWCGSRKGIIGTPRRRRCAPCLTDEATVQGAKQVLEDAKQPPLTAPVVGTAGVPYGKVRRRGLAAKDRLDARKKQLKRAQADKTAKASGASAARGGSARAASPRRPTTRAIDRADGAAAERRVEARIARLEAQSAARKGAPAAQAMLAERLAASRLTLAALRNRD